MNHPHIKKCVLYVRPCIFSVCGVFVGEGVKTKSLVPSPAADFQPNLLAAGMQPTKSSPSSCYVSINRMNDGRIKSWQTMRWLQSYVRIGTMLILLYVDCHVLFCFFMYWILQQLFLQTPFPPLQPVPTFKRVYGCILWSQDLCVTVSNVLMLVLMLCHCRTHTVHHCKDTDLFQYLLIAEPSNDL